MIAPGNLWYTFPASYEFDQAWDSPTNRELLLNENAKAARHYQCPSVGPSDRPITNYVAVTGPETIWPGCKPMRPAADGSDDDRILVLEIRNSDILWMEPRDLTVQEALDTVLSPHSGLTDWHGIHYVTVKGEVRLLDRQIDRQTLRALLVNSH